MKNERVIYIYDKLLGYVDSFSEHIFMNLICIYICMYAMDLHLLIFRRFYILERM